MKQGLMILPLPLTNSNGNLISQCIPNAHISKCDQKSPSRRLLPGNHYLDTDILLKLLLERANKHVSQPPLSPPVIAHAATHPSSSLLSITSSRALPFHNTAPLPYYLFPPSPSPSSTTTFLSHPQKPSICSKQTPHPPPNPPTSL